MIDQEISPLNESAEIVFSEIGVEPGHWYPLPQYTEISGVRPDGGQRVGRNSKAYCAAFRSSADHAEPVIGRRFSPTRWLIRTTG